MARRVRSTRVETWMFVHRPLPLGCMIATLDEVFVNLRKCVLEGNLRTVCTFCLPTEAEQCAATPPDCHCEQNWLRTMCCMSRSPSCGGGSGAMGHGCPLQH